MRKLYVIHFPFELPEIRFIQAVAIRVLILAATHESYIGLILVIDLI